MRASNKKALAAAVAMAMSGIGIASRHAYAANGTDTWVGNTSGNWADANWAGVNNPPITGDAIEFGAAGTSGTTLVDNLMTAATFTLSAINFDTGAAAFTINPLTTGTVNPNGFTLASATITDNAANTETTTDPITYTGNQNFTFANSGTLVVGAINDTSGGLTLTGAGTLRASGAPATNSGLLTLNSGTTLLTTQDFHCGGLTGSGNVSDPTTADKWFFVTNALAGNTETYSGAITGGASKLGFNYTGLGTLIMTGANQIDDAVNVNSGKVVFSGGHNNTTQGDGVGEVANANGILILPSTGTFSSNDNTGQPYNSSMAIATTANASGDLQNPGSTFIVNRQLAVGGSGYGAFTQTAGSTSVGGFLAVGGTINGGVVNLQGGTFTFTTSPASGATSGAMTIGFGGSNGGTIGNLNVSGNAQLIDNAANSGFGGGLWLGEVNNGILNMTGNAVVTISPAGSHTSGGGVVLGRSNATTGNGIVDLDGGTLTAPYVTKGSGQGTFNFNGGTLKANASDAVFMTGLTNAYIYGGGATIDDGGNNITIGQSLQAPSGSSVSATGLTVSGGGYIDTPVVNITGGGGTGAEAVATIDSNGNLTGINITNPGTGYTSAPTFALIGGGVGNTGSIGGTATLVSATSGGLTKQGAGSVTLTGTSTYTGATTVNAGSLVLGSTGSINGSSAINFSGGGKFLDISTTAVTPTVTITSGTLDGIGTLTTAVIADSASNVLTSGNGSTGQLVIGSLTLSGAATFNARTAAALMSTPAVLATTFTDSAVAGKKITVNAATTDPSWALGTYDLLGYTTLGSGNGFSDFQLGTVTGLTARQTASLSFSAGTTNEIALTVTGISGSDIWTGLNNGNWTTTVQTPNKNWTLNSSPTDFIAGDIVTFDDSATGTTNVSITDATVTPTSVTFNNSAKSYTIAGAGAIAGSTGVTVMGTGNVTISTNNTYTGGTTVNAGNLVLSGNNNFGAGSVTVSGGTATISGSNTYSGGTVLNSGVLNINNANALGSGTLTIAGGTIDTTAGALSLSTNNPQAWNGSFAFNGTNALNLGTGAVTLGGNTTVTTTANTLTVGGAIGDGGHGFALTKAGLGTLTLTGTSTYTGGTNVSGGTVVVTSTGSLTGSVNNPGVQIGGTSGVVGALVNSGTITDSQEMWLATADGGYGALTLTTGTITVGSWLALARGGGNAVLNVNGGTLNVTGANMTLGSFGGSTTDLHAVATFNAGSINVTNAVYVGEGTNAVLTVTGTAALTAGSIRPALGNFYGNPTGIFNLEGGTVTTGSLTAGGGAATANFNGGTLKASANSAAFMAGMANAYIWSGGLTLDDQGHSITMSQALSSPTGNGVTGNGLSASGTGYIAPPVVVVSGGGGTGATATANIDANGNLTGINITNPGVGYTSAPTFTLEGGGGAGSVTGSAALAANVGGAFTKKGAGTVTISGTSTYTGATIITAGTLALPAQTTPLPVALYTFNNVTDSSNNPVTTGTLAAGDIVVNSGSGGAALNGTVNIADSLSGMSGVVLSNSSPNKFGGNYANFDGTGTSIDVPSQIVDQSGGGNWTMSTWMQTNIAGSAFVSKNTGGSATGWAPGNSVFYLGSNPPSGTPGNLPTGVQNSGGFLQGNSNVADNNWHMVTFVDNGGSKSIYVDGVAVALSSSAFNNADVSNFVRIGFNVDTLSNLDGNINFAGNLTDLSFYGSALNSAQVTQLFNTNTVGTVNLQYLPAATPVNITTSGAALNINGQLQSIGSLAGVAGSQVMLGNGLLKVGGVSGSTTFAGTVTGTGILQLNGPGTLALSGANTYTGGTSVTGGLLQILSTGTPGVSALADGPVSISGGKLQLGTSTGLATITSLAISGTGTFDISNNHVIINYGSGTDPIASIAALLATGYAGGAWNGAGGITSSAVATNPGYGVGYADAADAGNPAGLASGTIEVKFTLLGDADLNGVVNGIDFGILAANFNKGVTGWDKGDFDYNNVVNGIDFGALAANFNKGAAGASGGASAGDWAALEQFAAANGLLADVPEPATLGLLAVAAVSTLSRRRRRRA
jgi:autotransporter-associated beta strand protein